LLIPPKFAGFTLLEMIVVMVIAGALVALTPPMISRVIPSVKLKGASQEMAAALRFLRSWSIAQGEEGLLVLDLEQKQYQITPREQVYRLPESTEVRLVSVSDESPNDKQGGIRFYPDGSSTGGRVILKGSGSKHQIDVDWLTGRISFAH
jgi:general secretion pathway protein H